MASKVSILQATIIPKELSVKIYHHYVKIRQVGPAIPCWTFVSEGNIRHKQSEVVFTLKAEEGEQPPKSVLELYKLIYNYAKKGTIVGEGDVTEFGPSGFLGSQNIGGAIYARSIPIEAIQYPNVPCVTLIAVSKLELACAKKFGITRLLMMMGKQASYFPFPFWCDRKRASVLTSEKQLENSVISQIPRARLYAAFADFPAQTIVRLMVPLSAAQSLAEILKVITIQSESSAKGFALLLGMHPVADGHFVWSGDPEESTPTAITKGETNGKKEETLLAGSFIAFLPDQKHDSAHPMEDGFVVLLTSESFAKLRDHMKQTKPFTIVADTDDIGHDMEMRWIETEWTNPVDGSKRSASGFQSYKAGAQPELGSVPYKKNPSAEEKDDENESDELVFLTDVTLLTPDAQLQIALNSEDLTQYVIKTAKEIQEHLIPLTRASEYKLIAQFRFETNGTLDLKIITLPPQQLDGTVGTALASKISASQLKLKPTATAPVEFQLAFQCKQNLPVDEKAKSEVLAAVDENTKKNPGMIAHTSAPAGSSGVIALGAPPPASQAAKQEPVD